MTVHQATQTPTIHWDGVNPEAALPVAPLAIAQGCEQCSYGLTNAPPISGIYPLYVERRILFDHGLLTFCSCRAGEMYKSYLVKASQKAKLEENK